MALVQQTSWLTGTLMMPVRCNYNHAKAKADFSIINFLAE